MQLVITSANLPLLFVLCHFNQCSYSFTCVVFC